MSTVLVIGAGRSSFYLIDYLQKLSQKTQGTLIVADAEPDNLIPWKENANIETVQFNLSDNEATTGLIKQSNVVVSLLPPSLHMVVARLCLQLKKHLATASYVGREMEELDTAAKNEGLTFLNELGLDPGLDHLSAMKLIDSIKQQGGNLVSFESYCGGLICEEDVRDNPWKYKFSWNPRNVILAAQGGVSVYLKENQLRTLYPNTVFKSAGNIEIPGLGKFDHYANRDSLHYQKLYGLEKVHTLYRSTLRRTNYCSAWQVFVELGFTDAAYPLPQEITSFKMLCQSITGWKEKQPFSDFLLENKYITHEIKEHFNYLQIESLETPRTNEQFSSELLQTHLMKVWKLEENDRDEIVMHHKIGYELNNQLHRITSTLNVKGEDGKHTAMAKTVGLPLAMGVEMILEKQTSPGVITPLTPEFYNYILPKLENQFNIVFKEEEYKK